MNVDIEVLVAACKWISELITKQLQYPSIDMFRQSQKGTVKTASQNKNLYSLYGSTATVWEGTYISLLKL